MTSARADSGDGPRPGWSIDLEPGTWISGRYKIVRCIGAGGVGAVYEAEQHSLGRQVAIKLLHPEQLRSAKGKERFEREARTAASINHRHVVAVHDFETHQGVPYLVMELLRGQSVEQLLATGGRLPLRRGLALLLGASRGLEALHASGLVHRDLKPANLFVCQGDGAEYCKILDFGITKQHGQNLTASSELLGTPAYMAPESIERPAEADQRVDIYALAVTAYEMFTGYNLYKGTPHEVLLRIMAGTLPPLSVFTAVMPESLARLLCRCLSKRPEDRPETAAELSGELDRILRELSASAEEKLGAEVATPAASTTSTTPTTSTKWGKRRKAVPLALACGALLLSLVAFVLVLQGKRREAALESSRGNEDSSAAHLQLPAVSGAAVSAAAVSAAAVSAAAASATAAPPVVGALLPPEVHQEQPATQPAQPELRARARAKGAARAGRRKNDLERSGTLLPRKSTVRGAAAQSAKPPAASANADPSVAVAPSGAPPLFVPRAESPQFVPRAAGEPGDPRPTSAKDRQPLAPGQLFRPRPSKKEQTP